jgi:hypothetical protein
MSVLILLHIGRKDVRVSGQVRETHLQCIIGRVDVLFKSVHVFGRSFGGAFLFFAFVLDEREELSEGLSIDVLARAVSLHSHALSQNMQDIR